MYAPSRLEFARQMLIAGAPAGIQVTQVAMDCGFNHLGKFARAYRDRFGEPPSETFEAPSIDPGVLDFCRNRPIGAASG